MISFLVDNAGNIAVGFVIALIVTAIIIHMIKAKKNGKSVGCGCGCSNCPDAKMCHPEKQIISHSNQQSENR